MSIVERFADTTVLDYIRYDIENDRLVASVSIEAPPSTFYLGSKFAMSNAIKAIGFRLADGTDALGLVNRFGPNGSLSNPKFFSLAPRESLEVNLVSEDTLPRIIELSYTTVGDNLTYDFDIIPAEIGRLRAQYWLGSDDSGVPVFDYTIEVSDAMVDNVVRFGGNFYVLPAGEQLFVRFSGVPLKGDSSIGFPYFISYVQPFREITINGHTEYVEEDIQAIFIGSDYAVNTTPNSGVTITIPEHFKDTFTIYDAAESFGATKPCILDFGSLGSFTIDNKNDSFKFFWDGVQWRYIDLNYRKGGIV